MIGTPSPIERVLAKIPAKAAGRNQWEAKCPSHNDQRASLSVGVGSDGKVVLHCHAGCATENIVGAAGLTMSDLFPEDRNGSDRWTPRGPATEVYSYVDQNGVVLFEVCRTADKQFPQRRPDPTSKTGYTWKLDGVKRVPFRLPQLVKAIQAGRGIFIPEGEKDVQAIERLGLCATCNPGGAGKWGKWKDTLTPYFKGATVYILPDNDAVGRAHAEEVARCLHGTAEEIRVVELPGLKDHGDVSDFIADGGTADKLKELVGAAPRWTPKAPPTTSAAVGTTTIATAAPVTERQSAIRSLAEILADPETLSGPEEVVPRLAWRGRVTLLAGREKLGKSTLAGAAAAAVSCGGTFIGQDVEAGPVLIIGLEEHSSDLAARLHDFGADHDRLFVLDALPPGKHVEAIEEAVQDIVAERGEPPRLIVVDTLPRFAEGLINDSGSAAQWGPVMSALTRMARTANAALILLHHARKSDGGYRDSTAVGAGVDAIIEMDQNPQDDESARKFKSKARWRTSDFTLRLAGNQYESMSGALSLETQIVFFIQANPGCSASAVRAGVVGRNIEIDAIVKKLCGNKAIRDQGVAPNHAYYAISGGTTPDGVADSPPPSALTPLGPTTDRAGTEQGQGDPSQFQTPSSEIGTGVQEEVWPVEEVR